MTRTRKREISPEMLAQRRFAVRCSLGTIVMLLIIALLIVTRGYTFPLAARWLDIGEAPRRTDYVMLLNGEPHTRPFVAAELFQQGFCDEILIAEVEPVHGREAAHETGRHVLTHVGVPDERIHILSPQITSTFGEAENLTAFLDQHPQATVTLVTSNYHTRRARWAMRKTMGVHFDRAYFVSAPTEGFSPANWWKSETGLATYTSEYCKLLGYKFVHGSLGWWVGGCAIALLLGQGWFTLTRWRGSRMTNVVTAQ
ncbi:MAG: YdcF family protein [Planctomycetia bacterium]|nr:YdcF family protein [Planctomycetia bacterium]